MKGIATRFTDLLARLRQAVAVFANRQQQGPRVVVIGSQTYVELTPPSRHSTIPGPTWLLLTERLGRLAQRFRALIARVEAGKLPKPRPPQIRPPQLHPATARAPVPRLPAARGWINSRIPDAASCAGTLIVLLQDPAMPELVARAPQGRSPPAPDLPRPGRRPPRLAPPAAPAPQTHTAQTPSRPRTQNPPAQSHPAGLVPLTPQNAKNCP